MVLNNFFNNFYSNYKVIFNYLKSDIIKKQRSFKIGLFTIFLVVFFIALLMNTISVAPIIFLRLSENQAGETDIIMTPFFNQEDVSKKSSAFDKLLLGEKKNNTGGIKIPGIPNVQLQFLNFTDLHSKLKNESYLQGLVPRWILVANSTSKNKKEKLWAISNMLIINSKLENKYGMGRKLQLTNLKAFECYVSESLFKNLKLNSNKSNNIITIEIKLSSLMKALGGFENLLKSNNNQKDEKKVENKKNEKKEIVSPKNSDNIYNNNSHFEKENQDIQFLKKIISNFKELEDISIPYNKSEILNMLNLSDLLPIFELFNLDEEIKKIFGFDNTNLNNLDKEGNFLKLNVSRMLSSIPDNILEELLTFKLNLIVKEVIDSDSGKWPSVLGNVIAIESTGISQPLAATLINTAENIIHYFINSTVFDSYIESTINSYFKDFNLENYALTVNLLLKDKFNIYKGDTLHQRQGMSKVTQRVTEKLGYDYPLQMQVPLYESFSSLEIVKIFLENIFSSVMFFLWILCIMLIYSLMLGNVDERTYEFGMLRAMGYKKSNLITMIIMQALIFSIPAIILALLCVYVINFLIFYFIFSYSGLEVTNKISSSALIMSVFAGLSIPLVSSYFPIKKALSENLKEALTIFNKKIGDISVSIVKLEQLGISPSSLLSSIILIIMGFATYYIAPLSFFLMDYSIFLFILNMILIVMIIGLIFILQLIVPKLQLIVLDVIMFFIPRDRNIKFIVQKNLDGHSKRNQKTSIMFMISLSFIIFAGCTLRLVSDFIQSASKNFFGANLWLFQNDDKDTINQIQISEYLDNFNKNYPESLKNYSFISYPLDEIVGSSIGFSSLCGFPNKNIDLISVSDNLITSGFSELYMYNDYDKKLNFTYNNEFNKIDLISGLYLNKNLPKILEYKNKTVVYPGFKYDLNKTIYEDLLIIIPEGQRKKFSIDIENPANIIIRKSPFENYPSRVVGLAIKIPGIPSYSSYSTISDFAPILISNNQMKDLINHLMNNDPVLYNKLTTLPAYTNTPDNIRKKYLLIKFYDRVPKDLRETVFFGVKNLINNDNTQSVFVDKLIESAQTASDAMEYFFIFIGFIALILSFFLIWTSFYCNIKDNICEYGIMRAIGISQSQSMRVYLYEASALILSSIIVGTFIGIVISTTLVLQFNLFSELPFKSNFPFKLYSIMCVSGFLLGLLGSYYPTEQVNKLSLVKILKGIFE